MKKGIWFEANFINFEHAVSACEVIFSFSGESWEEVKTSEDPEKLAEFIKSCHFTAGTFDIEK